MIFKVFFQSSSYQAPVREKTNAIYVEAQSEEEVRKKLKDRDYNIEFVTALSNEALEYEQQNENFKLENV